MRLAMIGLGLAGGKIVDKFVEYDERTGDDIVHAAVAVNTAKADLLGLNNVPQEHRVLVGQQRVKGHGVGGDAELAVEIVAEDIDEIQGAIDSIPVHEIDAFLVVAGLGGGTGAGGAPVVAKHLNQLYSEPVYGLGVLPDSDEGGIYTLNAALSFQTFVREASNLLVFDNDAWRPNDESAEDDYEAVNEEIVRRVGVLFAADEGADEGAMGVDTVDITETLACGGVSTIGYAVEEVEQKDGGLLSRFTDGDEEVDSDEATNRITSLVRKGALGRLTLPAELEGAERALLAVAGPTAHLTGEGIEVGRKWLEEQTGSTAVRAGSYSVDSQYVASCVLLSGVTNVPRIEELERVAKEAAEQMDTDSESEERPDQGQSTGESRTAQPSNTEVYEANDGSTDTKVYDPNTGSDTGESSSTDTKVYSPDAADESDKCRSCDADLAQFDGISHCPHCGSELPP